MLEPGQIVDRYRIDRLVHDGQPAAVYRADHVLLGTPHAIKVLRARATDELRAALRDEGRIQATLQHPNLVRVTDALEIGGCTALVSDWVAGPSLADWLDGREPPRFEWIVRLFQGIVRGVWHAHRADLVHRDLKPENVLLAPTAEGWRPRVTDFGLAKLLYPSARRGASQFGGDVGTPEYMAPEQIRDSTSVDARADLFSLGCILYELITGRVAFDAADADEAFELVLAGDYVPVPVVRPEVPAALSGLVDALLVVDRDRRIQSCGDVLAVLDQA